MNIYIYKCMYMHMYVCNTCIVFYIYSAGCKCPLETSMGQYSKGFVR